jgi:hypothetical protein
LNDIKNRKPILSVLSPKSKGKKFNLPLIKHKFNFNSIFSNQNIKEENESIYKRLIKSKSVIQINENKKEHKKYYELCRKLSDKKIKKTTSILKESFKGNPLLNEIFGSSTARSLKECSNLNSYTTRTNRSNKKIKN